MLNYQRVYSLANQARFCAQIQTRFWDEHQDVKQEPLAPGNDWKNWEWFAWFVRKISPNQWFNRKLKNQVIHQGANVTSMSECGPRDRNMSEWGDEHPAKKKHQRYQGFDLFSSAHTTEYTHATDWTSTACCSQQKDKVERLVLHPDSSRRGQHIMVRTTLSLSN